MCSEMVASVPIPSLSIIAINSGSDNNSGAYGITIILQLYRCYTFLNMRIDDPDLFTYMEWRKRILRLSFVFINIEIVLLFDDYSSSIEPFISNRHLEFSFS